MNRVNAIHILLLAALLGGCSYTGPAPRSYTVGYLTPTSKLTHEDRAATSWLGGNPRFNVRHLDLAGGFPSMDGIDVLWIHIPDSGAYGSWNSRVEMLTPLKSWYDGGGRMVFTGLAALFPHTIGMESAVPAVETAEIEDDWLFDQKGLQSYRSHPAFGGFHGGTYTWDADTDNIVQCAGFFGKNVPREGRIAGVEKAFITISADRRLMIEYDNGSGRAMTVGAYVIFGKGNNRRANLEGFMENTLLYVAGEASDVPVRYWTTSPPAPERFEVGSANGRSGELPGQGDSAVAERTDMLKNRPATGLLLIRPDPGKNFFDVAGRRALVMGRESGGIDEFWVHPFRVMRDYRAGIVSGDSVLWLDSTVPEIEVRPESFTRKYRTPSGPVTEIVCTALNSPAAFVHYEIGGASPVRIVIKFRSDLRLMWPYDAPATGPVRFGFQPGTGTLHLRDESGDFYCLAGANAVPEQYLSGQFDDIRWTAPGFDGTPTEANQVWHAALYRLDPPDNSSLNFVVAGTDEGRDSTSAAFEYVLTEPYRAYCEVVDHYRHLLTSMVTIDSPDEEFNRLYRWTLVGVDRFLAYTPGIGTGLLAGYATTARGWDGGQKISGRPGYAWYFGRDSEWSGFAVDDYGDFTLVRSQLELLQKFQDISGKIFHEISTSGSVHYDASDATPLYIILSGHYLRASGDIDFIGESWEHIARAMDYLYSTDTDGDLLIENTNQGHGWVEGGALWPVHTEFYLAGAWGKALKEAAYMAEKLRKTAQAVRYSRDAGIVREILNSDFWNSETRFFNFGKLRDGSYNIEKTVLPAVVMYFGLLDDEKVESVLEEYAGAGFSTDWGARIISAESPLFNPRGYHYGSVWPLFTGWTALGEYEYGNSVQGFTHITNNLFIKNHWALGFVEEVMNGAAYQPSGVCPHQCWSETNIIHPAITGMIGWKPDAPEIAAELFPRFPLHWDSVRVSNLRSGSSVVEMKMVRGIKRTVFSFRLTAGDALQVRFAPEIPRGMRITRVTLNGRETTVPPGRRRGLLNPSLSFRLDGGMEIVLEHTGGVGVVPAIPRPVPGDSSRNYRIVKTSLDGKAYTMVLEGKGGTKASVELRTFDQPVTGYGNVKTGKEAGKGRHLLEVEFPLGKAPFVRQTVRILLGSS